MTKFGVVSNLEQQPTQQKNASEQDVLKLVKGYHGEWKAYRKKLLKDWSRDSKLYNNERVLENRFKGVSDTFVPMTFGTIETMAAAIATADLSTSYLPQDIYEYIKNRALPRFTGTTVDENGNEVPETEEDFLVRAISEVIKGGAVEDETLEVLNALYDYWWDSGDWSQELEYLTRGGLKIGSAAWWVTWKGRPCLETVAFPDFIFDPAAKSDETCRFMGRKYLAFLDDLKKETVIDPKTGKEVKRYKNLNKVGKKPETKEDEITDKELKEEIMFGSTIETNDDEQEDAQKQVEVIEIMTDDFMYTMINRRVIAETVENPFKAQARLRGLDYKGIIPGISWANYKDESLYVGRSEISTFWKEQERLNDVTNQKSDAVTRALLQQKRVDPALKAQKASIGVPGAVIWGTQGQVDVIPQDQVPTAAFTEEVSVKNNIREVTATDQLVKGVGSTSDVTATEAKLQVASAGQRIELKIKSLERGPLKRLAMLVFEMTRLFIADPFIIPVKASNGYAVKMYNPKNYTAADFVPKVRLTIDSKNQQRQEQANNLETYKILISDPTNNLEEVKRVMLPKITDLDKDEITRISTQPQGMGAMGLPEGGLPPEAVMPPEAPQPNPLGAIL